MIAMHRAVRALTVATGTALDVTLPTWLAIGVAFIAAVVVNIAIASVEARLRQVRQ